ncbi:hypothetical protein CBER1_06138 [Cercospora berteroae]|uniref:Protein kinase domain-containing protein n=1 Tax=Cercospora berteroae TaxID=357750 RepID=A0A2S6C3M2_9PEZI|nr:hypothetical protein CBER1_06138 [Cercospora berteroae]
MSANGAGHNRLSSLMWVQSAWTYTRHPDPNNAGQQGPSTTWVRDQDKIASGGYGEVFRERCISPPGPVRAVKVISKPSVPQYGTPLDYGRELAAIGLFSMEDYEPFFVQSHGWYDDPENVYISMENIEHGSLQQHLTRPLREAEARSIVQQVLTGVEYMHQANYAHRDLKPAASQITL